jgi:glucose-6-phosphate isomerase
MTTIAPLTARAAWKALDAHYQKIREWHLRTLFADDPKRGERMTAEAVGIYFDYSKHRITDETLTLLLQLAEESGLRGRIDAMFRGDKINITEKRSVLHVALRVPKGHAISWMVRTSYPYKPGSWGPKQADALIVADRGWHNPILVKATK